MRRQKDGYILMLSLLILAIIVLLVTQLSQQASVQHFFSRTVQEREKARLLAFSGIQLAFDQLGVPKEEPKKEEGANKTSEVQSTPNPFLVLLKKNLATLNTQQLFSLKQDVDGIEGQVGFCITSEDGKLDINKVFDFKKKRFINNDTRAAVQALFAALKSFTQKDLFAPLEKFLKQRTEPLRDVTELLDIKEFQDQFANTVFYVPPTVQSEKESEKREKRTIFLTDLFTINGGQGLNVWVLSDSIAALLGLQRADTRTSQARKKEVEELIKGIKQVEPKVETMWDQYLKKLYGKDFKVLAKAINPILQSSLSFRYFTVLSYGTVGAVTQQLAVLIERINDMEFLIKKVYWL